ncbi:3'-5' exoribonuclease YhaM family protein [Alloacidobacterium sp.]|uniref:3'-5' exoribonuclease YhaM family protein n=1 Tax=Alloacidobacterium sp. TaxID=2951999 RepID=UPI002D65C2DB|nr:HD domain-containing protein [Alloacidobacterium sp.]HYK34366.1 HD domain-containing protein [Alloacidobacterium sp.]
MKDLFVADLGKLENQTVTGFFAVAQKQTRSTREGVPYFAISISDCTGQIECRIWEAAAVVDEFGQGEVVKVQGQVCRYQDKLQIKIDKIRKARPEDSDKGKYDFGDFVPRTSCNVDDLWSELKGFVASFTNPHLQTLLYAFLDDLEIASALKNAPAAKSMHHAWIGGLLEHIVSLLGISDMAARHYPEINRDLLLTGVVLHDIGKLRELRWGTSFDYTLEGQLVGHITIGISMVERKLANLPDFPDNLRILVEHIILSHHGKYEFGSPKLPMIPEALLLHYLDDLDAKMQTMRSEFARAEAQGRDPGQLTDWVRALERPLLNTAGYLNEQQPATEPEPEEETNVLPAED